jgi:membrane-associated phospholipid phosphatase
LAWFCCVFAGIGLSAGVTRATPIPQQAGAGSEENGTAAETSRQNPGSISESSASASQPDPRDRDNTLGKHVFKDFLQDQEAIWTGPRHIHLVDAEWLVPLGGAAVAMFASDTEVSKHLSNSPSRISTSNNLSNYGIAALGGAAGGMYLWGHFTHNDHMREAGFLAIEAGANAFADTYALKYTLRRERPLQDNYQGQFWHGGNGFPSEHASAAWSIASVIAHEYPGPITSVVSYGLAAAISSARVTGKDHFPSDVLVGSALGWFIGQEVYRHHHDPTLGGGDWETYAEKHESGPGRPSGNVGSPYVELDSWIYPALERLVALGYIPDAFLGLRPWTRRECARLLEEARDANSNNDKSLREADDLIQALSREFSPETDVTGEDNVGVHVDSVYNRFTYISGEPLRDGFDFGQTIINDFGRPYAEGASDIAGASGWASAGPLVGYARVEYQHAPESPALPTTARLAIQQNDFYPVEPPGTPTPGVNRVDLLEGYVGLQLSNWEISFGKQSEWWGPDQGGPMMYSNNSEPMMMFRINTTKPFKLPSILSLAGPIRVEFFLGQMSGHYFIGTGKNIVGSFAMPLSNQPLLTGQALSFKPTPNIEFGFTRTTIFAGQTNPFTPNSLIKAVFSLANGNPGTSANPGDRRSGFDLTYRLPWMRNWVTFYADGFTDDQITPVAYWDRSAWVSGLHIPQIPHIAKLDLRFEGVYTDLPIGGNVSHGFFYHNTQYLSGYTNAGNLLGSWIGRQGQGAQAWATYSFTPRNKLEFNFRHQKVSKQYIPQGGSSTEVDVNAEFLVRSHFSVFGSVQYERWDFPVIALAAKTDVTTSMQVTVWPEWPFARSRPAPNLGLN